ncbi:hypothetical protein NDU88_003360 [Pleurodeles waltl]|uniref:Uncharacterized protein n=1 Tax=Pleurodeles waltl TaxID=8319 RepID=A0AAV7NJ12_PLEWA|nr:hypothetical protein NDU88_003360 [Pleurodeles waltl]
MGRRPEEAALRLKQAESNVAEILPTHKENKNTIERLQQQVQTLQERVEDAEGRSRRNSVRLIQGTDSSPHGPPSSIDSAATSDSEGSSALFPAVTPQSARDL